MKPFEYPGELRLPTPAEQELVRRAHDELLVRNHPKQQGVLYLLCAVGCICIGAVAKISYLLSGAALFLLFFTLLLIQYKNDCIIAQNVLKGSYLVASSSTLRFTNSDWAGCDAQPEFEGSAKSIISLELDMTKEEIQENGCQQFLLVASEYGRVILQSSKADLFVYPAV